METVNNAVNYASKAIWGEPTTNTQSNGSTVPRTMPNETSGQEPLSGVTGNAVAGEPYDKGNETPSNFTSSQLPSTGTTQTNPLGHTDKESDIGGPSSTVHSNLTSSQQPSTGITQTDSFGHTNKEASIGGPSSIAHSNFTSSQQPSTGITQTDPLGHTNKEADIGGPSSTAHSNVKEPGFTKTTERSEELGARDDIKGTVSDERSQVVGTGPTSTSDGPIKRVGEEGLVTRSSKPEESGNPPAAISKHKNTNDETTDVAVGDTRGPGGDDREEAKSSSTTGETHRRGGDKISTLKTGTYPYGDAKVPEVVAKDLREGEHASERFTGHPEGKGEQYARFTDPEEAATAKGEDVKRMAETGKVSSAEKNSEEEGKEKLSMKDKIKAKFHH